MGDPGVQESGRSGLSTFLADHEDHGRGFDIQRREGSDGSIVRVVCGGCGKAMEYLAAGDVELPAEPASRSASQRLLNRDRAKAAKPAGSSTRSRPRRRPSTNSEPLTPSDVTGKREPVARLLALPGWLITTLVALLIGAGLLLVILGLASDSGISGDESGGTDISVATPEPTTPTPTVALSKPPPEPIKLSRRHFAERIAIGVPAGWRAAVGGGALTVASGNGKAEVQVYFEQGSKPDDELAQDAKNFLLQRHADARVTETGRADLGGRQASSVTVTYPTGSERAVVLVADGYTYLLLERLGKPVSSQLTRASEAVVSSFRPT